MLKTQKYQWEKKWLFDLADLNLAVKKLIRQIYMYCKYLHAPTLSTPTSPISLPPLLVWVTIFKKV